jgi:hypothetical protein
MDRDTITTLVREHSSRRNACLAGAMPVDLMDSELPAVLAAARTNRFVLRG